MARSNDLHESPVAAANAGNRGERRARFRISAAGGLFSRRCFRSWSRSPETFAKPRENS
jgi:hypothetical protein